MARRTVLSLPPPPIIPLPRSLTDSDQSTTMSGGTATLIAMTEELDTRQEKYLNWLLTPPPFRIPETKQEFADQNGLDSSTLRRWDKKPAFKAEWEKRVAELQGSPERTQRLLDSLYEAGLGGDNKAAQLYLQATNRLAPTQIKVEHTQSIAELTDAELDALIAQEAKVLRAERSKELDAQ